MNRIVIVVLILLVALILSAPFVFGVFAQHNVELLMYEYEKDLPPGVQITERSYDRGWLSSDASWRFTYDIAGGSSDPGFSSNPFLGGQVTVNLESTVHHGPMPVTAMSTDVGFQPAAMAVLEMGTRVTLPDGSPFDIPGNFFTIIKYNGSGDLEYHADRQDLNFGNGAVTGSWNGGDMKGSFSSDLSEFDVKGKLKVMELTGLEAGMGDSISIGPIEIDVEGEKTRYDFYVGPGKFEIGEIALKGGGESMFSMKGISLEQGSSLSGDNLDANFDFAIAEISSPMFPGDGGVSMKMALSGFNAEALANIFEAMRAAGSDPELQIQSAQFALFENFERLISGGPEIHLEELNVDTPMGRVEMQLNLILPRPAAGEVLSPFDLINRINGDAVIRVPQILVQQAASMNPMVGGQLDQFVENGFIQIDGGQYVIDAKYSNGLLNLNGLPMVLPPM